MTEYPTIKQLQNLRHAIFRLSFNEFAEVMHQEYALGHNYCREMYNQLQDAPAHWLGTRHPRRMAELVMRAAQKAATKEQPQEATQ